MSPKLSLAQRILQADERASRYLADANAALEAGRKDAAERLYEKAQFWKDRYNLLTGNGEKAPPRL